MATTSIYKGNTKVTDICGGGSTYTLPIATTSTLGGIKPDNDTIKVNETTGIATADIPIATSENCGKVKVDNETIEVDSVGTLSLKNGAFRVEYDQDTKELTIIQVS